MAPGNQLRTARCFLTPILLQGNSCVFPRLDATEANAAARAAFEKWRLVSAPKCGEIRFRVGELMKRYKEDLARMMTQAMEKVLKDIRGDVQEGIDMGW